MQLLKKYIVLLKSLFYLISGSLLFITISFILQIYYDYPDEYSLAQHIGTIVLVIGITEGLFGINKYIAKKRNNSLSRLKLIILWVLTDVVFVVVLVSASSIFIMLAFASDDMVTITRFDLIITNLVALIYSFIIIVIKSLYETNKNLKDSIIKMEQFKKDRAEAQFHSLKKQLSPHFLFNTLNTLYGIIDKDAVLAKDYLVRISEIYRYVLTNENDELIELKKELNFAKDYAFLISKRYGEAFELIVNVPENLLKKYIPPLTLQLLVENALKHNKLDINNRLSIFIYAETDTELLIKNNITIKNNLEKSSGLGLKNLSSRYIYLNNRDVLISNDGKFFTIAIPLIKVENYESIDNRR